MIFTKILDLLRPHVQYKMDVTAARNFVRNLQNLGLQHRQIGMEVSRVVARSRNSMVLEHPARIYLEKYRS